MAVVVVTEAEATRALAAGDTWVSAAALVPLEVVVATVEPGLAVLLAVMAQGISHPESRPDATAVTAATGKGTIRLEARLAGRLMVLARDRKAESLPGSLLGRQDMLVAITSRETNRGLAMRVNLVSSPVIIRGQIGMSARGALA